MQVRLLGGLDITVGDRRVASGAWRLRKAKTVVKLLALAPGHRLHRERLCDALWPDLDPESATNNLHQALHAVRRALGSTGIDASGLVVLRDGIVVLGPDGGVTVDLDELTALARRALAGSGERVEEDYRAALALAEQQLLPEDAFEPWAQGPRDFVRERRLAMRMGLVDTLARDGRTSEAADLLRAATMDEPLHEPAVRALMRVLAGSGRRHEALGAFERLREALRRDLAADPDPLTRRLYRDLLAGSIEDTRAEAEVRRRTRRHNLPVQTTSSWAGSAKWPPSTGCSTAAGCSP